MASKSEIADLIRNTLIDLGVTDFEFGHTKKHACVTFRVNGREKKYTFYERTTAWRAIDNIKCAVKRLVREMQQ